MRRGSLVLLLGLAACADGGRDGPPDVLIYLVDTLRADHLGTYGYERETDPELARFAEDAVRFANAYSPSSWTRPATATLLTGLPPGEHGAVTGADRLADSVTLLSERLAGAGYRTAAWSANPNVLPVWGFGQGFEDFADLGVEGGDDSADGFFTALAAYRARHETEEPFFYYLHTMEPHHPYAPPAARSGAAAPWPFRPDRVLRPVDIGADTPPALMRHTLNAYDGEIAYSDEVFGRLLAELRASGRYDDTLIVYVSDHGEEFLDHGLGGHQRTLYEEMLRVPLLVKLPGNRLGGTTVADRTSLLDVVPTVLAAVGLAPGPELPGLDLARVAAGAEPRADERALFFDLDREGAGRGNFVVQAVREGPWKLLRGLSPEPFRALYDLEQDPKETRNLLAEHPELAERLLRRLDAEAVSGAAGFHLAFENAPDGEPRSLRARLTTSGRFVRVTGSGLEAEDRYELAEDGRTLEVAVRLENVPNPADTVPRVLIDVDGVGFRLEPPEATLALEPLPAGDAPGPALRPGAGPERAELDAPLVWEDPRADLAVEPDALRALRSSDPAGRPARPRLTLLFVPPAEGVDDPELDARLGHLGYVDGDEDGDE